MKSVYFALLLSLFFGSTSCRTYISSSGKKYRQFAPVKDKTQEYQIDTLKYAIKKFSIQDFVNKRSFIDGKRIIVPVAGLEVKKISEKIGRLYVYFWNSGCSGTNDEILMLDSMSQSGIPILILALRHNYDVIDAELEKTYFRNYPYYVVKSNTNYLADRQIAFIKDLCIECYKKDADEVMFASYLLIDKGQTEVLFMNSENNIFK